MSVRKKGLRAVAACVCLLALALLYVPLAAAALLARGADCCPGGFCKIAAHRHAKQSPKPEQHSAGMTCEHEGAGSGMTQCTMSCCQDTSRPAILPVAFVLPATSSVPELRRGLRAVRVVRAFEILGFARPLSPPPRFASLVF